MSDTYSIYFAGDLFNHKDLIGNLLLSEAIEKESSGRYLCVVPQHLEQSTNRSIDIRNSDLSEIIKADLILLNFDGTELDSGTVVEFLFAKALDIPAVILRSDFRAAGDQERGDPWNLMCSGYPRTAELALVLNEPSLFDNEQMLSHVYEWALRFPGNGFTDLFSKEELTNLLISKQNKGSVLI